MRLSGHTKHLLLLIVGEWIAKAAFFETGTQHKPRVPGYSSTCLLPASLMSESTPRNGPNPTKRSHPNGNGGESDRKIAKLNPTHVTPRAKGKRKAAIARRGPTAQNPLAGRGAPGRPGQNQAAARKAQILRSYRTTWTTAADEFEGRRRYWHSQSSRVHGNRYYHKLTDTSLLTTLDVHLAICSVTEAINSYTGRPVFGLISAENMLVMHTTPEIMGPSPRAARPGRPLFFPWNFVNSFGRDDIDQEAEDEEEGEVDITPKIVGAREEKQEQENRAPRPVLSESDGDGHRHTLLIVAEMCTGYPWVRVLNSSTFNELEDSHKDDITSMLKKLQWFPGETQGLLAEDRMFVTVPAADQSLGADGLRQPCGIHTILNAWAMAINLGCLIDTSAHITEQQYVMAIDVIKLALSGRCDFWLIYSLLVNIRFISRPRDKQGVEIDFPSDPSQFSGEPSEILRLLSAGAMFFTRTMRMDGLPNAESEYLRHNGEVHLNKLWSAVRGEDVAKDPSQSLTAGPASSSATNETRPNNGGAERTTDMVDRAALEDRWLQEEEDDTDADLQKVIAESLKESKPAVPAKSERR
ncbi:hypothetical protein EG328_005955 [Venturia inaequalis]|uniref:Uncharacterized protein n=1 Tax=Venturia inaequalis TaxID=5025 RepID=A0A8H3UKQ8_VENIN|nr:hypothetical protein EG328_005955 [Venturia inaequalis]